MGILKIGNTSFIILRQEGRRVLLSWIEASGIEKTRWVILDKNSAKVIGLNADQYIETMKQAA